MIHKIVRNKKGKVTPRNLSVGVKPKIYWVALKLQEWDNLEFECVDKYLPFPIKLKSPDNGEIGFLPVFSNMEDVLKYVNYDKYLIGQIREVDKK